MRTPRLRLLSAILAVALFFTLLPVSALAEDSGSTGVSHVAIRTLDTNNKDDQGLTYTLNDANKTATVANYDNSTQDGVIDIPDTVTSGGQPYTVTAIGNNAFESSSPRSNVSSVFIPATVLSIGDSAFNYCNVLTTVTFAEGSQLKSIGRAAFYGTEHAYPRFKEIKIPDSVETIGNGAFYDCRDLERITLPSALQTLSPVTFYNCTALSEVTFPASLKTIESSAFSGCRNLSKVKLPASLKAIQSSVFHRCSALKTVSYDGSLEQWNDITANNGFLGDSHPSLVMDDYTAQFIPVKDDLFAEPIPKKTVTITKYTGTESTVILPSTINSWPVTKIGEDAFQDNTTITSVTIPDSVTEIGANAFAGCTNLTSVTYGGDWSNLTIQSGNPAVEDAANEQLFDFKFTPDNTAVIVTRYNGTAADVTIPSRYKGKPVTVIDPVAFYNNSAVTSVTIPDSVTAIPDYAFGFCSQLTNISIPNSVTFIGFSAFNSCTSLKSITLPSSLSTIQSSAFYNCGNLETIRIPVSVTFIGNYAFAGCPSSMTVTYPGSKTQWDAITKGSNNDVLENNLICAVLEATFTADGTTLAPAQTIDRGGKFTEPAKPPKENHTFAGWYNGDEKFDFDADTTSAPNVLNLVAKWDINQYTVKFVSEHGSFADQTIEHGKTIKTDELTIPPVEGFTFDGWYADENRTIEFDFTKPITGDTKVYAKWTANDYEVRFITEHGNAPTSQNVQYNGTADDPGKLTAEGYTFIGWYADEAHTKEFDFSTPITSDTKVYAKWKKNAPVFPDTYELNVSGAFVYVDGVDVTAPAGDTTLHLEKDVSVRLVADPDRMPSGMVFDRWTILNGALNADDAEKFETGRTLEEFAFTMPAEPLSIEATPRMQEEEGSDTVSVIAGVTLGTAATALVAWQAYDLGMSLYQEHWLPADFVMPKTRAELALLLWNTAGRPAPAAQPAFADITDPDTAQAAQWAAETGLMTPKSADRFKPEKSVTRWKAIRSWKRVTNQNP